MVDQKALLHGMMKKFKLAHIFIERDHVLV